MELPKKCSTTAEVAKLPGNGDVGGPQGRADPEVPKKCPARHFVGRSLSGGNPAIVAYN